MLDFLELGSTRGRGGLEVLERMTRILNNNASSSGHEPIFFWGETLMGL